MSENDFTSNKQLIQYFKKNLSSDQDWVEAAIVRLYDYQTESEKVAGETHENNGVGFSGSDGNKLSYFARWIKSGKHLSGDYLNEAFDRVQKYAKQLISISDPYTLEKILNKLQQQNSSSSKDY